MRKNGFTIMEFLAVIALIGILVLLVMPNVIKTYNKSIDKAIEIEEKNILDAAKIYIEDYCLSQLDSSYKCPETFNEYPKYITLDDLYDVDLITKTIKYKDVNCCGIVVFDDNNEGKTYLTCGTQYYTDSKVYSDWIYIYEQGSSEFITCKKGNE